MCVYGERRLGLARVGIKKSYEARRARTSMRTRPRPPPPPRHG